jgi:hypothetical protein
VRGVAIEVREINVTRIFYKSGQTRDTKTHDDSLLGTEGVEIMLKKNPQQKVWVAIDLPFVSVGSVRSSRFACPSRSTSTRNKCHHRH